ncbi:MULTISPECIES: family 16 glycosylhydrolase [unclassified Carboxylicivirga]|uniref:family 16 glycosylhydrolase n=1 Tax=Carboxylicivirga TaxID=1628153 RepID=UPI003D34F3EC
MKQIPATMLLTLLMPLTLLACSSKEDAPSYEPDFSYEKDTDNANYVVFTNQSQGDYLYVEWDFGNGATSGKSTDKDKVHTIYYPLKGSYEVELRLWGSKNTSSDTKTVRQTVVIDADDPDYVNPEDLLWSDEFNGSTINFANWTFETGDHGWGNQELQNYTNGDNAHIEEGKLIITAQKVNDDKTQGSYTSSRIISKGKQAFTYGRIEVRAKLPHGTGVWPAIWLLGANFDQVGWPACGEIDMMEYVGFEPNVIHSSLHNNASYGATVNTASLVVDNCEEDFNVYGMLWTENSISFYVNDRANPFYTYAPESKNADNWPFNKPHFIILNVAVGGTWGGAQGIDNSIFPQTMEIDYVRVFKHK